MSKKHIFVFPCGSEIGLEIHRSLKYEKYIEISGGSSIHDHGRFVYENYIGDIPFISDPALVPHLRALVNSRQIDAIYPATDAVIATLKAQENAIGCKVIASPAETSQICNSKRKTMAHLKNAVRTPYIFENTAQIERYPVFVKPDVGHSSLFTSKISSPEELNAFISYHRFDLLVMEYLPGSEFTVDCFTDRNRRLMFVGPRTRNRVINGISVHSESAYYMKSLYDMARSINENMELRGAWFFQAKISDDGKPVLMEVASRLGGSSGFHRNYGINFALLSIDDAFDIPVEVQPNHYHLELDRYFSSRFKIDLNYNEIYVGFDDCLIINNKVNTQLIAFLYQSVNQKKKITLLSKHPGNLEDCLRQHKLTQLFDYILHLKAHEEKSEWISSEQAIFIDGSFSERQKVAMRKNIAVFSPDMVECLLKG